MKYEDLEEVRKNRAKMENAKATAGKGKRRRKRKLVEAESEIGLDPEAD